MHNHPQTDWTDELMQVALMLIHKLDTSQVPRSLFEGTILKDHYISWGKQTYLYVQETPPNLLKSARRMKRWGRKHAAVAELLLTKSAEEQRHHEWILSDLRVLGCSREEVEQATPCLAVQCYIATYRFHAEQGSPYAILGPAMILEVLSALRATKAAANLVMRSEIPGISNAISFISLHGQLDGGHVDEALAMLRGITCPKAQEVILASAKHTASLLPHFFPG